MFSVHRPILLAGAALVMAVSVTGCRNAEQSQVSEQPDGLAANDPAVRTAVGSEIMQTYGPDSTIGRTAAVMLGSTETTFYTVAVYYGAAGIRRPRHTIPAALAADITGFLAAAWTVRWMF